MTTVRGVARTEVWLASVLFAVAIGLGPVFTMPASADETCQSPFLPKVTGQEDFIYVWTLGVKGVADGNDSIVTVDANPASGRYGQIVHRAPVPGQHEAHHAGFTDDRRFLWAGGSTPARSSSSTWPRTRPSRSS